MKVSFLISRHNFNDENKAERTHCLNLNSCQRLSLGVCYGLAILFKFLFKQYKYQLKLSVVVNR